MKTNKITRSRLYLAASVLFLVIFAVSCSDNDEGRRYEAVKIAGVKVDNVLYLPTYTAAETRVEVPAGKDLSKVKLQVLVANGTLAGFPNNTDYDCRKPLAVTLAGYDGTRTDTRLRVVSAPKLASFIIEGVQVEAGKIYTGTGSLIVQVPPATDLTALKVTMEFTNGTPVDFENGRALDYTEPQHFTLLGVDEETSYPYEFIITTEVVGPASVKEMTINGVRTDSVVADKTTLIPYVPALSDFTSADVTLTTGFGNKTDEAFTGRALNLLTGENTVKVTGSNGVTTEFTIATPQLSFDPLFAKTYAQLQLEGFAANDLTAVGFSGSHLLAANYTSGTKMPVYFDFTGTKQGTLDAAGVDPTGYGFRKFACDDNGSILALSLGMSSGEQRIYKWNTLSGQGQPYLSFSKASLGVDYDPRAAGINLAGSLAGDAVITLTIAQKTDVFVWTVQGGVLNPTPKKYAFPYTGTSYYWSVEPLPLAKGGFIGFATTNNADFGNGLVGLGREMTETFKMTGRVITDGQVLSYNGRTYLAYTAHSGEKGEMFLCDITDGQPASFGHPIFHRAMEGSGANGNATLDAALTVIDGKLYAAFACTNIGLYLYRFSE